MFVSVYFSLDKACGVMALRTLQAGFDFCPLARFRGLYSVFILRLIEHVRPSARLFPS